MIRNYLSVSELRKYIFMSESYIYKKVECNQIPHRKVGRRVLFIQEEIDRWVDNGYTNPVLIPELPNF
ncbi:MAG: excisionase family DNA-binding protein [Bacteroidales bacterium]